jgi:hypothetical protein
MQPEALERLMQAGKSFGKEQRANFGVQSRVQKIIFCTQQRTDGSREKAVKQ